MKDWQKIAIGAGGILTALGFSWLLTRKPPGPAPGEGGAAITIVIYDSQGNPVLANSPVSLVEGGSYTARLSVTNNSTKAGQPIAATLRVGISGSYGSLTLIPASVRDEGFNSGQTRIISFSFNIPVGITALTVGEIIGMVFDPSNNELASARQDVSITPAPIVYGAGITITP